MLGPVGLPPISPLAFFPPAPLALLPVPSITLLPLSLHELQLQHPLLLQLSLPLQYGLQVSQPLLLQDEPLQPHLLGNDVQLVLVLAECDLLVLVDPLEIVGVVKPGNFLLVVYLDGLVFHGGFALDGGRLLGEWI